MSFILGHRRLRVPRQRRAHRPARRAERPARSVGRPQPRVDDRQPAEGAQLRRHPARSTRSTSSSTASTKRIETEPGSRRVGRRPRSCSPSRRRNADAAHPHAVAVVLADRAWRSACRSSAYGLIFNHVPVPSSAASSCCSASTAGRSSRRSPTTSDDDPPPHGGEPTEGAGHRWLTRPMPARRRRRRRRRSRRDRSRRPHAHTTDRPVATTSWRCGCSSASECLLFGGLISTYMLYRGRAHRRPGAGADLRHPVHLVSSSFVLLMSSLTMVLAVSRRAARDDRLHAHLARRSPPCSARPSSAARSTSSRRSTTRASASRPACSARASTRSPASTASTSPSASSC